MKKGNLLRQFDYTIIPRAPVMAATRREKENIKDQLPLMSVAIDFENGHFHLEGNWQFLVSSNKYAEQNWLGLHRERVQIETAMYPSCLIDLDDDNNDGLIFPLEGIIRDDRSFTSCTGLVVLDNTNDSGPEDTNTWKLSFYLYDIVHDNCEIKFRLPVYLQ